MDTLNDFFATLSGYLWGWPMIILLLGTHVYLTIRLGIPQRKILTAIRLSFSKDKDSTGDVSQFGALATALTIPHTVLVAPFESRYTLAKDTVAP